MALVYVWITFIYKGDFSNTMVSFANNKLNNFERDVFIDVLTAMANGAGAGDIRVRNSM